MRVRAGRSIIGLVAWIAVASATFFIFRCERQLASMAAERRTFDLHARETADAVADLRAAQQAYVAAGQGVPFWVAKVTTTGDAVRATIAQLRESAADAAARAQLDEASAALNDFSAVDRRALEYINAGQPLMAGDMIFAEGGPAAAAAGRHVEAARTAEDQAGDSAAAGGRRAEARAAGGAAAVAAIALLLLIPIASPESAGVQTIGQRDADGDRQSADSDLDAPTIRLAANAPMAEIRSAAADVLATTADLATDFARVRDLGDLKGLLERAAKIMDASGVVVWLGSTSGADLQPIVSHGYTPQMIARMPAVPRHADNAAAKAYRTGSLQIVLSRPGGSAGALVAPLLAADGCIGALSAEIRSGGEGSTTVQSLATIVAAHVAAVFAATATDVPATESKAANL